MSSIIAFDQKPPTWKMGFAEAMLRIEPQIAKLLDKNESLENTNESLVNDFNALLDAKTEAVNALNLLVAALMERRLETTPIASELKIAIDVLRKNRADLED